MAIRAPKHPQLTNDEIRKVMLRYFYGRNNRASSRMGKKGGAAVTISVLRAELKTSYQLERAQVVSNLNYLVSQGWIEVIQQPRSFATPKGGIVPSTTPYFIITAAGIDKIEGPSDFTRDRFQGIRIEATGRNIITVGDGNQINASFREVGEALADLRTAIASSSLDESQKMDLVADIDSMQSQLAKPHPDRTVLGTLWTGVQSMATLTGLADAISKVVPLISGLLR